MEDKNELNTSIKQLLDERQSLFLATMDQQGIPFSSYAPYALDLDENCIYVLLSDLSSHSIYLRENPNASILITEDEADTRQIYARNRIQYKVTATYLEQEEARLLCVQALLEKHGNVIEMLSQLPDFRAFKLKPSEGRYVIGFGKTYVSQTGSLVDGFEILTRDQLSTGQL